MNRYEDFGVYLHKTYPALFPKEMYIECGTGWFDIIDELSKQIYEYLKTFPTRSEPYAAVVQIKEKFGGLRYYIDYHGLMDADIQKIEDMIRETERKSLKYCEDCGSNGTIEAPKKYWMRTLCQNCINNYDMGDTPNGI